MKNKKNETKTSTRKTVNKISPTDLLTMSAEVEASLKTEKKEKVGERIKKVRQMRNLTPGDLSSRTGISVETIKLVEANKASPPLGELIKIGKALEMNMGYFISPGVEKTMTVVRADERRLVSRHSEEKGRRHGYVYESLAPEKSDRMMEPFLVTLLPTNIEETSVHDGQEFIFVLEGQIKARVGNEVEYLNPGDAIYYDSGQPHFVRAVYGKPTKILAVLYTGTKC